MKKLILTVALLLILGGAAAFFAQKNAAPSPQAPKTETKTAGEDLPGKHIVAETTIMDAGCGVAQGMTEESCEQFMKLWKQYHEGRLGIMKQELDRMTQIERIWVIGQVYPLYRIDYYVVYGGIKIRTHDQFPLRVFPGEGTFPALNIPRDGGLLSVEHIAVIGKMQAWNSNLTDFPKGDLAYATSAELEKDIIKRFSTRDVPKVSFSLIFSRDGAPQARITGESANGAECYYGTLDLRTKQGDPLKHWGPCMVN
jgi:hypothetical protein